MFLSFSLRMSDDLPFRKCLRQVHSFHLLTYKIVNVGGILKRHFQTLSGVTCVYPLKMGINNVAWYLNKSILFYSNFLDILILTWPLNQRVNTAHFIYQSNESTEKRDLKKFELELSTFSSNMLQNIMSLNWGVSIYVSNSVFCLILCLKF